MEVSENVFNLYVGALALSGILMLVVAAVGFGQSGGARALNGVFGAAFLGYAVYLFFFLPAGGEFEMFWYAFIVPVYALVQVIRAAVAKREQAEVA